MTTAFRRPAMSAPERAKLIAYYDERQATARAADPTTSYRELFKLATSVALIVGSSNRVEHHEILRRCFVLKAWAAVQIARLSGERRCTFPNIPNSVGYWREARIALSAARSHRRIATWARKDER